VTPAARRLIARIGYDPSYGARPLKRAIQQRILDPLAMKIVSGELPEGSSVAIGAKGDNITFS
jgi:ATP-dependent Clp protease ATP-binding subunit ClpA